MQIESCSRSINEKQKKLANLHLCISGDSRGSSVKSGNECKLALVTRESQSVSWLRFFAVIMVTGSHRNHVVGHQASSNEHFSLLRNTDMNKIDKKVKFASNLVLLIGQDSLGSHGVLRFENGYHPVLKILGSRFFAR